MSTSPSLSPTPREPLNLARLATGFAVAFGIAFGLCTAGAMTAGGHTRGIDISVIAIYVSVSIEAICLLGLLVTGAIAVVRSFRN